jgi:hypothetical protein
MRRFVMASRCAGPLVGARFVSQVDTRQQAAFLVEGFDRYEETLQPSKFACPSIAMRVSALLDPASRLRSARR